MGLYGVYKCIEEGQTGPAEVRGAPSGSRVGLEAK